MPHTNEEMMEKMAAIEHERWAKWQKYIHSKILPSKDDDLMIIGSEFVERWERQINTPYEQLSEKEKESDREQVRPYLDLISDLKKSIREEIEKEIRGEQTIAKLFSGKKIIKSKMLPRDEIWVGEGATRSEILSLKSLE